MSSQAAFTGAVVPSILIPCSLIVEQPPELCQSRSKPLSLKPLLSSQHLSFSLSLEFLFISPLHPLSGALHCMLVIAHVLSSLGLEGSIFIYIDCNCSLIVSLTWRSLWIKQQEAEQRQTRVIAVYKHFLCSVEVVWASMFSMGWAEGSWWSSQQSWSPSVKSSDQQHSRQQTKQQHITSTLLVVPPQ